MQQTVGHMLQLQVQAPLSTGTVLRPKPMGARLDPRRPICST